ncbi:MAG TPA: DUF2889 domain-containing protein [Candidatus Sulfotelmatobacter sp.]|nr:DUF2889 domain-containing protein [Candidatus Sulfotelmatobacter sp.]
MPLSAAKPREQFHNRTLDIKGYRRQDGLWDIEGHLRDVKPAAVDRAEPGRAAGEPIHEMWLRLTIDEMLLIREAEASTERSPYRICPDAAPNFSRLAGIRIGPGWMRAVRQRVGGVHGCTHLVEMLGQMATTAMQTLWTVNEAKRVAAPADGRHPPPGLLNSCHAYDQSREVVRERYPAHFKGAAAGE